jgi:hypothetical protein
VIGEDREVVVMAGGSLEVGDLEKNGGGIYRPPWWPDDGNVGLNPVFGRCRNLGCCSVVNASDLTGARGIEAWIFGESLVGVAWV